MNNIRPIAMYLPQFHPIPENNKAWGEGFTEWTNVRKAKPLFEGHYQPHVPNESVGYYDLRDPSVLIRQADLAREHGIFGFCYYHYWFSGKLLLERPVDKMLESGEPDFPFMLCWANENWTRRWDGAENEILVAQRYSAQDDVAHARHLIKYFEDPRYIRVDDKPVFVLYKPFLLPNPTETAQIWRTVAAEHRLELYLCHMVFAQPEGAGYLLKGFDAVIDFEPGSIRRISFGTELEQRRAKTPRMLRKVMQKLRLGDITVRLNILPYKWMYEKLRSVHAFDFKLFPSVVPGWDNSARRKNSPMLILKDSTPQLFQEWLELITDDFRPFSKDENFIFLNAWNEWAEGNHLEPCAKWGNQYLDVVKKLFLCA